MKHLRGLTHIEGIRLTNARITDAGLGQLKGLRNLRYMGLAGTRITDAGLEHLQDLRHLKTLSLGNTRVTDDGLTQLKASLPNCKIIVGSTPKLALPKGRAFD